MKLSPDQTSALKQIMKWLQTPDRSPNYFSLGGYAGTGKTTLTALLRQILDKRNPKLKVALISYTGKAAQVLKTTLKENNGFYKQDFVGTIHSLIYAPVVGGTGQIISWDKKSNLEYQLIIVDEASMVNSNIWTDLVSFNLPILAIGDHGQLPPIEGSFNLMTDPNIKLEKIHRQAADNPIIQLSIQARETGFIPVKKYAAHVEKLNAQEMETQEKVQQMLGNYQADTMVLCGYNHTRVQINDFIRQTKFFEPPPEPLVGDQVICLKNNHQKNIYNGMIGIIDHLESVDENYYYSEISFPSYDTKYQGNIYKHQFGNPKKQAYTKAELEILKKADLFDFGYALTVHKAQGSQAKKVILFEERFKQMTDEEWRRWLYTGVTRAEEELLIVGPVKSYAKDSSN